MDESQIQSEFESDELDSSLLLLEAPISSMIVEVILANLDFLNFFFYKKIYKHEKHKKHKNIKQANKKLIKNI